MIYYQGTMEIGSSGEYTVYTSSRPYTLALTVESVFHCGDVFAPTIVSSWLNNGGFTFAIEIPSGEIATVVWNYSSY